MKHQKFFLIFLSCFILGQWATPMRALSQLEEDEDNDCLLLYTSPDLSGQQLQCDSDELCLVDDFVHGVCVLDGIAPPPDCSLSTPCPNGTPCFFFGECALIKSCIRELSCSNNAQCPQGYFCNGAGRCDKLATGINPPELPRFQAQTGTGMAELQAGQLSGFRCSIPIEPLSGSPQDFSTVINEFPGVTGQLAVTGFGNPSICYNLKITNPEPASQPFFFTFKIPTVPVDAPYTVETMLDMELTDGSGNGVVTVTPDGWIQSIQGQDDQDFVTGVGAFSGANLGQTTTGSGPFSFAAGPVNGPPPTNAGDPMTSIRMFVSFELSGGDTAQLRGKANLDTGSGATSCVIPPLPSDDPTVEIPTLSQWSIVLLTLLLMTLATWQLTGRPILVGMNAAGEVGLVADPQHWLNSLLFGQIVVAVGLLLYAMLIGPLGSHDGVGAFLAGFLVGAMIECYRRE